MTKVLAADNIYAVS